GIGRVETRFRDKGTGRFRQSGEPWTEAASSGSEREQPHSKQPFGGIHSRSGDYHRHRGPARKNGHRAVRWNGAVLSRERLHPIGESFRAGRSRRNQGRRREPSYFGGDQFRQSGSRAIYGAQPDR